MEYCHLSGGSGMTKGSRNPQEVGSSTARFLRITQLYKALSEINQAIVRMRDEDELFPLVCRVAVDFGGVGMAWIGVRDSETERLVPIQAYGTGTEYAEHIVISTSVSSAEGCGPSATAFREGRSVIINHFKQNPMTAPWYEQAKHFGWGSSGAFPIQRHAQPFAQLSVYHHAEDFFDVETVALFEEMTRDISFALDNFDRERQRQMVLESLQASQRHFRAYFERSMVGMAALRPDYTWLETNESFCKMLGYTQDELFALSWSDIQHPDDLEKSEIALHRLVIGDIDEYTLDKRLIRKDGSILYVRVAPCAVRNDDGSLAYSVSLIEDITERKNQERVLQAEREMTLRLLETLPVGVVACDGEGQLSMFNDVAKVWHNADLLALPPDQWAAYYQLYEADGITPLVTERIPLYRALHGETVRDMEMTLIDKGRSPRTILCNATQLRASDGRSLGAVVAQLDITERKQTEARIQQLAFYDSLTGLPNRHTLEQYLPEATARAQRHHTRYAIGFIDLDDFKPINDRWGHQTGDELLRQLAGRLRKTLRETDFIARLGGDEFVVVFEDLNIKNTLAELRILLERLHQAVETPFDLGADHQVMIDMTLGLAIAGQEDTLDALLRQTDAAMYQAKQHKAERTHWWWLAGTAEPQEAPQVEIDPFGLIAQALLSNHEYFIERLSVGFMEAFYDHFQTVPRAAEILTSLNEQDLTRLKHEQIEHLRFITSPLTTREALCERSQQRGRTLVLMGVDSALMVSNFELYQRQLAESLDCSTLRTQDRYRLLKIIVARHDINLQYQIRSIAIVRDAYYTALIEPLSRSMSNWHALMQTELDRLGGLPGVTAVILMRPDAQGHFIVEAVAGSWGGTAAEVLGQADFQIMTDPHHPRGQGIVAHAWRDMTIHNVADYLVEAGLQPWREAAKQNGARSALAIPIRDSQGHATAILEFFGTYPHQFSGSDPLRWAESLQHRFEVLWRQRGSSTPVVPSNQVAIWRERLFTGGLRLVLQPIIDLESGRVIKAEGLARLVCEDGTLIYPGQFLPLLGANELYQLFWLTLTQAIDNLRDWQKRGLDWSISINLAPSSLLESDLAAHIKERLNVCDCSAGRLTLEVLESENITQPQQEAALHALKAIGVGLALDDLGAGYASLLRVVRDPLDVLKIDQNLIRQLPEDPLATLVLLWTLINLAKNLKHELVVEGLETPALIEVVQQLGAPLGQGYGIARPMPAEEFPKWAKGFQLPVHHQQITTFAGALSRHWAWQHTHATSLTRYDGCPITDFLKSRGFEDAEVSQWHRRVHADEEDRQVCSDHLLDWLVTKVREEGVGIE